MFKSIGESGGLSGSIFKYIVSGEQLHILTK